MAGRGSPSPSRWWTDLSDECPITLEPLSTLPYPPFRLGGGGCSHSGDADASSSSSPPPNAMYFDGLALASYCVSRATFTNPLTREALTWEDCVRLDDYLEEHCYHHHHHHHHHPSTGGGRQQGRISVKEAYGLRSMVKVSGGGGGGGGSATAQEEANRRRADALRSEAAAALRGLFVYGNNRTGTGGHHDAISATASPAATFSDALVVGPGARSGEMVPSAGFALHRLREGGSIGSNDNSSGNQHHRQGYDRDGDVVLSEVEGLRIIDDDAAVAFGSDEAAWREVQEAFPTIGGMANADTTNVLPRGDVAEHPERSALLQRAQEVAAQTKRNKAQKQWNEERGRQILIEDALKRRAERLSLRQEIAAKQAAEREAEKAENEEMARARAEIERWREEQFDMLNRIAEETRQRESHEGKKRAQLQYVDSSSQSNDRDKEKEAAKVAAEAAAAERAAKKKAAKKKKERERQKAKKAAEKKEQDRLAKIKEEKKRREEADLKCPHCSAGILDEGFEKLGFLFCSPKCARAGAST